MVKMYNSITLYHSMLQRQYLKTNHSKGGGGEDGGRQNLLQLDQMVQSNKPAQVCPLQNLTETNEHTESGFTARFKFQTLIGNRRPIKNTRELICKISASILTADPTVSCNGHITADCSCNAISNSLHFLELSCYIACNVEYSTVSPSITREIG